jgi:hypothetical protein
MRRNLFSIAVFFAVFVSSYSQKAPIKFGDVSLEELQMKTCYLDTTASAAVLCDYGFFRAADVTFKRTIRIKIFKKEGYGWANRSFQSSFKSSLRGVTTNLENGKIVQSKLSNQSIYSARVINDYYELRAAMPNVKVGSVIDLEFTFQGIPREWWFQEEIPVLQNELSLEEPRGITFRTNYFGFEHLWYSSPTRWIARDMPAIKAEPYISSIENYRTKLKLDLANFSQTWQKINEELIEASSFTMSTTSTLFLNDISHDLKEKFTNRQDLLKAACDTVRERIVWNNNVNLFSPDGNLANVYRMKVGNSAEINILLYRLLKKLDFEATPVALSTRENGVVSPYNPSVRQLNYVIVQVKIGEKEYLLDATERYMPYYLLPLRCLNVQGRLVDKNKDEWVTVSNSKKNKELVLYDLHMDSDLVFRGNISFARNDYAAFDFRKKYFAFNSQDEYVESYIKEMPGLTVKDISFENLDSVYKPVSEKQNIEIRNQVNQIESSYYILPAYFATLKENPFKMESRKYPVDFGIPIDKTVMLNLTVPDGYSLATLPQSVTLRLPDNSIFFMYEVTNMNNKIQVTSKFGINKTVFTTDEYNDLREFYNQVLKKQSEPIILKKL